MAAPSLSELPSDLPAPAETVEVFSQVDTDLPATACFAAVIERWAELRGDGDALPADREFGPERWRDFVGRISVLEPVSGGQDFQYVIYAGAIVHAGGVDMTGHRVSEFPYPDFRDASLESHRTTLSGRRPKVWRFRHLWRRKISDYCTLNLPVQRAGCGSVRLHSFIVNTDPRRRSLYTARFMSGLPNLAPDDLAGEA